MWLVGMRVDAFVSRVTRALGAPGGQPPRYYRDTALSIVFTPAVIVVMLSVESSKFNGAFVVACAIAAGCLWLAKVRRVLFGAAIAFAGLRFAFAFLVTQRLVALLFAIGCGVAVWAILATVPDDDMWAR